MIVRRARVEDAHEIAVTHVSSWQQAYRGIVDQDYLDALSVAEREARWVEFFEQGNSEILVAEATEILGFSACGASRDKDAAADVGELYAIYVAPSYWSTGVGRALWLYTHEVLRNLGYSFVAVWVLSANQRAIRFYRALGFEICAGSETMVKIGNNELPEVRYEVSIG